MKHQTELNITIREWLAALRQAGLSPVTLEKYDWHMERLSRWLEEREVVEPEQISKTLLRAWGRGCSTTGRRPRCDRPCLPYAPF